MLSKTRASKPGANAQPQQPAVVEVQRRRRGKKGRKSKKDVGTSSLEEVRTEEARTTKGAEDNHQEEDVSVKLSRNAAKAEEARQAWRECPSEITEAFDKITSDAMASAAAESTCPMAEAAGAQRSIEWYATQLHNLKEERKEQERQLLALSRIGALVRQDSQVIMEENEILVHALVSAMGPRHHEMAPVLQQQREQRAESAADDKKLSEFLEFFKALAEGEKQGGAQKGLPMSEGRP